MPSPQIKICGIGQADALEAVIAAGAEYAGFIFYPPSPRNLTAGEAAALTARAEGRIKRVGLFVNASDEFLGEILGAASFDALQFQGSETPQRVAEVKARFGMPVWKAISVSTKDDIQRSANYRGAADFILFDAKTPKGALPGGMGLKFDWSLLSDFDPGMPWGLAGGLGPDNVAEAITGTHAPMVDVCSGTECAPGIKDMDKIKAFCKAARST